MPALQSRQAGDVVLVCLKCERRVDDAHREACPDCGAKEWLFVDAPQQPLKLTKQDRVFLRINRILVD